MELYNKYKVSEYKDFDEKFSNIINLFTNFNTINLPNILLHGDGGSGKKSLIYTFLGNKKKTKVTDTIKINSRQVDYILYKNNTFIEIDISNFGIYKKQILTNILQRFISTRKVLGNNNKLLIIHNLHLLNIDDQFILRKMIEKTVNCRFILLANNINNLLEPIKSRCFIIKMPGFSQLDIKRKIKTIIKEEKINITPKALKYLYKECEKNMKKAIMELEYYVNMNDDKKYIEIKDAGKNTFFKKFIKKLKNKKNKKYEDIDVMLYKLLINYNMSSSDIINNIFKELSLKGDKKKKVIDLNYRYEINMTKTSKKIISLQSYVCELYEILKTSP